MLNSLIELHDSEIGAIARVGEQVIVFLSHAYIHQSEGRAGSDPGTGWSQAAALAFAEGSVEGELPECPAGIWEGDLLVDGQVCENQIPIPCELDGDVALKLSLDSPAEIIVRGRHVTLVLIGDPVYVEEFPGNDSA